MNRKMILHILGSILIVEACLMLPSVAVGLIYAETATTSFMLPIVLLLAIGFLLRWKKKRIRFLQSFQKTHGFAH